MLIRVVVITLTEHIIRPISQVWKRETLLRHRPRLYRQPQLPPPHQPVPPRPPTVVVIMVVVVVELITIMVVDPPLVAIITATILLQIIRLTGITIIVIPPGTGSTKSMEIIKTIIMAMQVIMSTISGTIMGTGTGITEIS